MNEICQNCRKRTIGCSKFCSDYKSSFDHCIIYNKWISGIRKREEEILKEVKRSENK